MPTEQGVRQYKHYICGWGASMVNISVTFPLHKVIFQQQLLGVAWTSAVRQVYREGLLHLYRGLLPPLIQKSLSISLMFGCFEQCRAVVVRWRPGAARHPLLLTSLSAACAGGVEALLMPFERMQTLLLDRRRHAEFRNMFHVATELRAAGVREFYRGYTVILLRNAVSNSIFFAAREPLRNLVLHMAPEQRTSGARQFAANFLSGALLGACISTLVFPLNVTKTRMQVELGGPFLHPYAVLTNIVRERHYSVRKLFIGSHLNFSRSLISWGIINSMYELFMQLLFSN